MRILVYGGGNIGSLYAAPLKKVGLDISILERGKHLAGIRDHGITLENAVTGEQTRTHVKTIERLDENESYDLVLVILPKNHVSEVLPILAANRQIPSFMFFGNNALGPGEMTETLGRGRVLLGFPGAAAVTRDHRIRYLILTAREQPTTLGELDGTRSSRVESMAEAFAGAGFPVSTSPNIDAWLKTHAAEIIPTACALYMAAGDPHRLAANRDALRLMLRAIHEAYGVLHQHGIPIMPAKHRAFKWLPERILLALARRMLKSNMAAIKIGHVRRAQDEIKLLADEFRALARKKPSPTSSLDRLYEYLHPSLETAVEAGVDS